MPSWLLNCKCECAEYGSVSIAFLLLCSKALSSYRHIRRKYREQVWRLEQKVAAMAESQQQSEAHRAAADASEWRREETVLWPWESPPPEFIYTSQWLAVLIPYSSTFMTEAGKKNAEDFSFATAGEKKWNSSSNSELKTESSESLILKCVSTANSDDDLLVLSVTCKYPLIIPNRKSSKCRLYCLLLIENTAVPHRLAACSRLTDLRSVWSYFISYKWVSIDI